MSTSKRHAGELASPSPSSPAPLDLPPEVPPLVVGDFDPDLSFPVPTLHELVPPVHATKIASRSVGSDSVRAFCVGSVDGPREDPDRSDLPHWQIASDEGARASVHRCWHTKPRRLGPK